MVGDLRSDAERKSISSVSMRTKFKLPLVTILSSCYGGMAYISNSFGHYCNRNLDRYRYTGINNLGFKLVAVSVNCDPPIYKFIPSWC